MGNPARAAAGETPHIAQHDSTRLRHALLIVGSAGCFAPLRTILDALPPDADAAGFVVVHYPPTYKSVLPKLLARTAQIRVRHADDGAVIERGCVYVAPPGLSHLIVENGHMYLRPGQRVLGHVPAGDPLLISAAKEFGARAIGIVLSGADANGAAGLRAIKDAGGIAMVQLPREATFSRMPLAALAATQVDLCAEAATLGARTAELCKP